MSENLPLLPVAQAPEVARQLEQWSHDAEGSYSANSRRAYRADLASFTAWCSAQGLAALPALPSTVAAYLRAQADAGRAFATVKHRAAAVALLHRAAELPNPCDSGPVRLALKAIARRMAQERPEGTGQKQAPALVERDADRIVAHVDTEGARAKDVRDLALLLVGRDLLARASELVALTVQSVAFDDEDGTALVSMLRFKTDTEAHPYLIGPEAAEALKRWLTVSGLTSGPLFVSLTKGGKPTGRAITTRDVGRIVKALGKRASLEPSFSAHSLRVGMANDLVAANIEGAAIMQAAGWQTPAMLTRYTRKLAAKRGAIAAYHARRHK